MTEFNTLGIAAEYDICECGHSRAEHAGRTGQLSCTKQRVCKCVRFTWSHFELPPELEND